jgi:hypothetical protein
MATFIKIVYSVTNPTIKVTYDVTNVTIGGQQNAPVFIRMDYAEKNYLSTLYDVSALNASDGDVLQYVSSTGLWTKTSSINFGSW